jgi:hypothetical protein
MGLFWKIYRFIVAVIVLLGGLAVLWKSSSLMLWLIHEIGEERALGSQSVIHLEGGGKLLTNPGAMVCWTLPFWFMGGALISAGIMLLWPAPARRPSSGAST